MHKCLLIVDIQKGFISEHTKHILERIDNLVDSQIFDCVIATRFVNKDNSPYRKFLLWDKLSTEGEIALYKPVEHKACMIVDKYGYSGLTQDILRYLTSNKIDIIFIAGIDTDCCVLATAIDLFEHNIRPFVLEYYCASNGGIENHNAAIKILERLIGNDSIIKGLITKQLINKIYRECK